jgi:hypothetical protein
MLTQEQLEALLGRPLTPNEIENLSLYLEIAQQQLEDMLCTTLEEVTETRTYDLVDGNRSAFVDIFTSVDLVTVDGEAVEATPKQWDRTNADWYNVLRIYDCPPRTRGCKRCDTTREVEVTADWGFTELPGDLALLLAKLFALNTTSQVTDGRVRTKRIEDFSVTYADTTTIEQFGRDNSRTLQKYSMCNMGEIAHGRVGCIC